MSTRAVDIAIVSTVQPATWRVNNALNDLNQQGTRPRRSPTNPKENALNLTSTITDRAAGVLLGQAIGDALGVPYEFASPIRAGEARMVGGGLGPYAPGEWSDDTQMAICIAQVTATGSDLRTAKALNAVARSFLDWQQRGASDIGAQTSSVLHAARRSKGALATRMTNAAQHAAREGRAGNGALMRTGVVGLVSLDDRQATADAARRVAGLTHADDRCLDSCVLWSEAVRVAVVEGRFDVRAGLDLLPQNRRAELTAIIDEAENRPPAYFAKNGYTITAMQAAWSSIHSTRHIEGPDHVELALQTAISIGHDTDTVAAIAGALLGARYGVSGLSTDLARRVHGWPGLRAQDLIRLALGTATQKEDPVWPGTASMLSGLGRQLAVPHPADPDVLLGTEADLARCVELGVTAVVSLSRVGAVDTAAAGVASDKHAHVWLVDSDDPEYNSNLAWTIEDAARTIKRFRDHGERVLVHCVAAQHRTPTVALAYALLRGQPLAEAIATLTDLLGPMDELLWETVTLQKAESR
ncbi:ADP-ribosylglycohydrolase family protein [Tessaracoccus sp. MC1679]|nr:ADP-ribosylglycohydrolase family protein [Tessaracoccus sp. MC1679]